MQIQDIRKRAEALGIQNPPKAKPELIRAIQLKEGNFDCYGRAEAGFCDQAGCLWREDCIQPEASSLQPSALVERIPPGGKGIRGQGSGIWE